MTRYLPTIVALLGYGALFAGASMLDARAGLVAFGLVLVYEAREAER